MPLYVPQYNNQLSYIGGSVITYASPSNRLGGNGRGQLYNEETYLRFNPTALAGLTVVSCTLECILNGVSVPATSYSAGIYNQLRKPFLNLTAPIVRYDDFDTGTAWGAGAEGAAIQTATVPTASSGTVTFFTNPAFVAMVQDWVNGTTDWQRGLVLAAGNTGWYGFYNTFSSFQLTINTSAPVTSVLPHATNYYGRLRSL